MSPSQRSRQDLIRAQQRSTFVGRVEQLETFKHNLTHLLRENDGFAYPQAFLFNVWGQGGVGKSTLLRQFEEITKSRRGVTARLDEAIVTVPEAMAEFAKQLANQNQSLSNFSERYKVYRQRREELETDPDAPQGFSALVGKSFAKVGLRLGRQVPIAGAAFDLVDETSLVDSAGEWAAYVTRKLKNKDEIQLINEPIEVLTPLFLKDLQAIADRQIVLLFDTYERTREILEAWLLEILAGRHGTLPANCIWVIAGREQLSPNHWSGYEPVQLPLERFTEEEATQFLQRKGVTNPEVVNTILEVSDRLPLLLAMLAEGSPQDPAQVREASGTAVERFLKWVEDPAKRQLALDAALPQHLNRDVIAHLVGEADSEALFSWLKTMPFVRERSDGWAYHDVVRGQMLRYQHRESANRWAEQHRTLAEYYDGCCQQIQLNDQACYSDETWQTYALRRLYHRLCSHPKRELSATLNQFLDALHQNRRFAQQLAALMAQTGCDLEEPALQGWGERLVKGLKAYEDQNYAETIAVFTALLQAEGMEAPRVSIIHAWRGEVYRLNQDLEKALADYDQSIELNPQNKQAIARRGLTYVLMERYPEALVDVDRTIEIDPHNKDLIACRAGIYGSMGRYPEALVDFNRAIELDPQNKQVIALRGEIYRLMKRYPEALVDFNRAIELDPQNKQVIALRGITYQLMKRYPEALTDFNRVINLDRQNEKAIICRAGTYGSMGRYPEALADYDQAIELDPQNKEAISQRDFIYQLIEEFSKLLTNCDQVIELDPQNKEAVILRGRTYLLLHQYRNALTDFTTALEMDTEDCWHFHRALAHIGLKQFDSAKADLTQAVQRAQPNYDKDPNNHRNTVNLALYYLVARQPEKAKLLYQNALTREAPTGIFKEAIQDLKDLLIILPNYPKVEEMQGFLESALSLRQASLQP